MPPARSTLDWYSVNATDYASRTAEFRFFPGLEGDARDFIQKVHANGIVLDAGSGGGRDARFLLQMSARVIALDASRPLLGVCLAHCLPFRAQGLCADLRSIPLSDHSIDGIWASGSVLHLLRDDIPYALEDFARVLKPGCPLALSMKEGHGEELRQDGRHFTYVTREELVEILTAVGFVSVEVKGPDRKGWLLAKAVGSSR